MTPAIQDVTVQDSQLSLASSGAFGQVVKVTLDTAVTKACKPDRDRVQTVARGCYAENVNGSTATTRTVVTGSGSNGVNRYTAENAVIHAEEEFV